MSHQILLISDNPEDLEFWRAVAEKLEAKFQHELDPQRIREYLGSNPECLVFWDANPSEGRQAIEDVLEKGIAPSRVFAISDEPLNRQPELFKPPIFSHHIFRRYRDPASFIYPKLIAAAFANEPFGLEKYFPEKYERKSMHLKNSLEKGPALQEIHSFLEEHGVPDRIVSLGVDAADELIMNAIFDAPWKPDEGNYRRGLPRGESFDLDSREQTDVEIALCDDFIGIKVGDNFGSLKRESILKHLGMDHRDGVYDLPEGDPGAGLGLHKLNQLAMALLFVTSPQTRTEVMVFFGNAKTYREFRLGYFSFFSIMDHSEA